MCEKSIVGLVPMSKRHRENPDGTRGEQIPVEAMIPMTNMDNCQRSGVFVNNSAAPVEIATNGSSWSVAPGMVATVPVGRSIMLWSEGSSGTLSYLVTTAALPASIGQAPPRVTADEIPVQIIVLNPGQGIRLSHGNYTKLTAFLEGRVDVF